MTKLLRTLAVAAAAAVVSTGAAQAAKVALFTNTTYVDYIPTNINAEASNLEDSLKLWNHDVRTFTGITSGSIHSALEGQDAVLIPELEKFPATSLFNALSAAARTEITDFVNGGGSLVFFFAETKSLELVNGLFGYALATTTAGSSFNIIGGSSGTAFQGGVSPIPANNATIALDFTTLPTGSRSIYISGSGDAVSVIPQGAGYVIFMGWDWFDAAPTGTQDGGWLSVLNAAVNQAVDPTKADVALLSDTTYVDYILGNNGSEASNLQASILEQGHKVMPFDTITSARFASVLAGRDTLAIPEQEAANLFPALTLGARDEIRGFVNGGGKLLVFCASCFNSLTLVNNLFGFAVTTATSAAPYGLDATAAAGTPFAGGPASLPSNNFTGAVALASLPPGARAIYRTGSAVTVASLPVGCGTVTLFGWDWFGATPEGGLDGGWLSVLNRALGQDKRVFVKNDFNGDGHGDVLWRDTASGDTVVWEVENAALVAGQKIGRLPVATWTMAGTGDFNRDCKADILWRNNGNGVAVIWLMDGFFRKAAGSLGVVPLVWTPADVVDYNGDRAADILWRRTDGTNTIFLMDGTTRIGNVGIKSVPPSWVVED